MSQDEAQDVAQDVVREPKRKKVWPAAGGGALVGVAATVGVLLALGWLSPGEGSGPESLTLPDTLDGMRTEQAVLEEADRWEPLREEITAEVVEHLSEAYDGAAATGQGYLSDDMELMAQVYAVAGETPGLWSAQDSEAAAELIGLAAPQQWVEQDGAVECLVRPQDPSLPRAPEGGEEVDIEPRVMHCQLVEDGVTLLLLPGFGMQEVGPSADLLREAAANLERG